MNVSTADARQVGGDHYKVVNYEHWTFAGRVRLGYYEGQVSKYVDRHQRKNKAEDLDKALHFAEKAREMAENGEIQAPGHQQFIFDELDKFYAERKYLGPNETSAISRICTWRGTADLDLCIAAIKAAKLQYYGT